MVKELYKNFNISSNFNYGSAKTVDYVGLPFEDNSMYNEFKNNQNIVSVSNISSSVTNMVGAFAYCNNISTVANIPSNATLYSSKSSAYCYGYDTTQGSSQGQEYKIYLVDETPTLTSFIIVKDPWNSPSGGLNYKITSIGENTFNYIAENGTEYTATRNTSLDGEITNIYQNIESAFFKSGLTTTPELPEGITDLNYVFYGCDKLQSANNLPNSIQHLTNSFTNCTNLTSVTLPTSSSYMYGTFWNCTSLAEAPVIPNSVTDMTYTFRNCTSLINAPVIPSSLTHIYGVFGYCSNLTGNIFIKSENITNASSCFYNTSLTKNVYIPYTYLNGTNTATYNSFINAGYDENGSSCGVYLKDINEGVVTYNPTCGTNTSTPWWSVFSDTYTIHNNERLRFKFKTYSAMTNNWDCWLLVLNDPNDNTEYLVMREDAYGWGTYYNSSSISHNFNWDTFKNTCLNNVITYMEVSFHDNKLYSKSIITGTDDVEYTYNFATLEFPSSITSMNIKFTCENSYLTLPTN